VKDDLARAEHLSARPADSWLVALDIDGTVLHEDGTLSRTVISEVQRVAHRKTL
jgi:Predicted hydrolases of the HAD superfamily